MHHNTSLNIGGVGVVLSSHGAEANRYSHGKKKCLDLYCILYKKKFKLNHISKGNANKAFGRKH